MSASDRDDHAPRDGEIALPFDPAEMPPDAGLVFIGRIRSPWLTPAECPKNMRAARERGGGATVEIDAPWRQGLAGLERFSHVVVLSWLDRGRRDLIVQRPRHSDRARGVFALRSPVRPNPVGLHVVPVVAVDLDAGTIALAAIDVLDGTPVIDIKPYFATTDAVPDATDGKAP